MPDAPEVAIKGALLAEAQAFANSQSLTIAFSKPFTPPPITPTAKWLRATVRRASTQTLGLGANDANKHYGFMQIDSFYGQGAGDLPPDRIASAAISYFSRGSKFTRDGITVEILEQPEMLDPVKDDPWVFVPVRVRYCCFANPA